MGGVRSNMPDLLPQTPQNAAAAAGQVGMMGSRGIHDSGSHLPPGGPLGGGGGLGSPHPSQQELAVSWLSTMHGCRDWQLMRKKLKHKRMDLLLLGSYTRLSCTIIKLNL